MKVTALLTGRGNNTLPDKNVIDILGKPVLHYPAQAAKKSPVITNWYCSSDNEKILAAAEKEGYRRILRPAELATPTSKHIECINHALDVLKDENNLPDIIVVLLANNITIKSEWVTECVEMMIQDQSLTAVVPVYQDNDHHPMRAKSLNPDNTLCTYEKDMPAIVSSNRQELPPCYYLAHNFWVLRVDYLLSGKVGQPPWNFMGDKIMPYFIDESIDIHDITDLVIAKSWILSNFDVT